MLFINDDDTISLVETFIASNEFGLFGVNQHIEKTLLENETVWKLPKDFITICQHNQFINLYKFALDLACNKPKIIFESNEFLKMKEEFLIQLLKRDDLDLKEFEIWEY